MEFQTRSEETGVKFHPTLEDALKAARDDISIWKISFTLPTGERFRLVWKEFSDGNGWVFEPIMLDDLVLANRLYEVPNVASDKT